MVGEQWQHAELEPHGHCRIGSLKVADHSLKHLASIFVARTGKKQ